MNSWALIALSLTVLIVISVLVALILSRTDKGESPSQQNLEERIEVALRSAPIPGAGLNDEEYAILARTAAEAAAWWYLSKEQYR